jgi:hypothetical protein
MKLFLVLIAAAILLAASEPWSKNPQSWTAEDAQRILNSSPWAQETKASFGADDVREAPDPGPTPGAAEAGMAGPRGATDGRWDGGVGKMPRGSVPTLSVLIRWDSALPIREAAAQVASASSQRDPDLTPATAEQATKDYVITLIGLVPARRYRDAGQLSGTSRSDDGVEARDPEELLEGLMSTARLLRRGRRALAPENVRIDGATGVVHIFFPRTDPIVAAEKDVVFSTRFGSLLVQKSFRPRDMIYKGRLEL